MNIALIGYGAMGKLIQTLANDKGNQIAAVIDELAAGLSPAELAAKLAGVDVAIDFSTTEAVLRNVEACMIAGVPLVEGTTGWNKQRTDIERLVSDSSGSFVFGSEPVDLSHRRRPVGAASA